MTIERAAMRAARAVHERIERTVDQAPGGSGLAVVRVLRPLTAELADEPTLLTQGEDLELSAQLKQYDAKHGIKVGDMLVVHELRGFRWMATGVLTDDDVSLPDPVVFYDVRAYGAAGDGTLQTAAVAAAITDANAAGGGIVFFPAGSYRIKNVDILDNVTILCASGVTFKFPTSGVVTFDRLWFVGQGARRSRIRFYGNGCVFDPSDVTGYGTLVGSLTGLVLEAAQDFVLDGIQGVGFKGGNLLALNATDAGLHCERGLVSNMKETGRTDGGYGIMQITGARYVTFDNLWSSGGYAINVESDRRTGGADEVTDIEARNLYTEANGGIGGTVFRVVMHSHAARRLVVRGARSVNAANQGIYLASQWDLGGSIDDVLLEDVRIESPVDSGVRRENGTGEVSDIHGLVMRRVRVTGAGGNGFMIGSSAVLEDCSAENCGAAGFTTNSTAGSAGSLPYRAVFTRCKAIGNGTQGFMNYGNCVLWELLQCRSELNGARPYDNNTDTWMRIAESHHAHGQSGWYTGTTAHAFEDIDYDPQRRPRILGPWSRVDAAASLTNVALATVDPPGAAAAVNTIKMDHPGSIISIIVRVRAYGDARSAGTLTVEALKNGSPLGTVMTTQLNATTPYHSRFAHLSPGTVKYVEDDVIGVRLTTDSAWAPVTSDIDVWVVVADNGNRRRYIGSSPPGGALIDGDVWIYTGSGLYWEFVYDSTETTYKWKFVGGPPLFQAQSVADPVINTGTYVDTNLVPITLPRAGDYDVEFQGRVYNSGTVAWSGTLTVKLGAAAAADAQSQTVAGPNPASTSIAVMNGRSQRLTGRAANDQLGLWAKTSGGQAVGFTTLWMRAQPVRVS